jgi:sporulation integral membrane protein YlbJ
MLFRSDILIPLSFQKIHKSRLHSVQFSIPFPFYAKELSAMTEIKRLTKEKKKARSPGITEGLFGVFSLFCIALILKNTEAAVEYVTRGLRLSATTVIPSLFPFMVLSELVVSSSATSRIPPPLLAPFRRLLGLPNVGVCAVLLGLLCGFPVGARCIVAAYEAGDLTKSEAERAFTAASCPSSAFLVGAVGGSLWGNRRFGIALYATVVLASLLSGVLANLLQSPKKDDAPPKVAFSVTRQSKSPAALFCEAVRSSLFAILTVCAYVVFFSALMGTLELVLGRLSVSGSVGAGLSCLFELSGGVAQASALGNAYTGACLCAFAVGWSGLSVHCQMMSVCDGKGLSLRPYLLSKLFQGLFCALFFALLLALFPEILLPAEGCVLWGTLESPPPPQTFWVKGLLGYMP